MSANPESKFSPIKWLK
ncbi:hypothetical protein VCHENC02_4548A, partial [Vibrio harveyi]